jgi:hypothetical protein
MDSSAGIKRPMGGRSALLGLGALFVIAMDLLSDAPACLLFGFQCFTSWRDTMRGTAERWKIGFHPGGEGVDAASCSVCVYPFVWTKFICIASDVPTSDSRDRGQTEPSAGLDLNPQKKERGRCE